MVNVENRDRNTEGSVRSLSFSNVVVAGVSLVDTSDLVNSVGIAESDAEVEDVNGDDVGPAVKLPSPATTVLAGSSMVETLETELSLKIETTEDDEAEVTDNVDEVAVELNNSTSPLGTVELDCGISLVDTPEPVEPLNREVLVNEDDAKNAGNEAVELVNVVGFSSEILVLVDGVSLVDSSEPVGPLDRDVLVDEDEAKNVDDEKFKLVSVGSLLKIIVLVVETGLLDTLELANPLGTETVTLVVEMSLVDSSEVEDPLE